VTHFRIIGLPGVSGTAGATELTFCVHIEGWSLNRKYAKIGHRAALRDTLSNLVTPRISRMAKTTGLNFVYL